MESKLAIGVLIADTHLSENTVQQNRSIFTQVFALCKRLGVQTVLHLGDIFTSRKGQTEVALNTFKLIIDEAAQQELQIFAIAGNHDKTSYTSESSYLNAFDGQQGFFSLSTENVFKLGKVRIYFLPYFDEQLAYPQKLEQLLDFMNNEVDDAIDKDYKVLITHCAIDGVVNNGGVLVKGEVPLHYFKQFDKVFVGHYHNRQTFGNVVYTGSSDPRNFGEDAHKGCVILYEDGSHEFVGLDFKPYVTVDLLIDDLDLDTITKAKEKCKEANVRFRIQGEISEEKKALVSQLNENGIKVEVHKEIVIDSNHHQPQVTFSDGDILEHYNHWADERGIEDKEFGEKLLRHSYSKP